MYTTLWVCNNPVRYTHKENRSTTTPKGVVDLVAVGSKLKGGCTASFSPPMNSTVCSSSLFDTTEENIYNCIHREIYMLLTSFVSDHLINILEMKKVLFYQRKKKGILCYLTYGVSR